jgi:hypothetical protein
LEDKLICTRIIWYGHILRMNEEKIPKKVPTKVLKGRYQEEDQDKDGNSRLGKMSYT